MDGRAARVRGVVRDCGLSSSWSGGISYHAAPHAHRHCASHVAATGVCAVARARFGSSAQHTCRRSPPDPARLRVKSKAPSYTLQRASSVRRDTSACRPAGGRVRVGCRSRPRTSRGSWFVLYFHATDAIVLPHFVYRFLPTTVGTHHKTVRGGTRCVLCTVYVVVCSVFEIG